MVDSEIQRALGRIEGSQGQILLRFDAFDKAFAAHGSEDSRLFLQAQELIQTHKKEIDKRLEAIELQNQKLQIQDENASTIGKYILGILGTLFTLVGTAVIAALTGHMNVSFHR